MRVQVSLIVLALLRATTGEAFGPCPPGTEVVEGRAAAEVDFACLDGDCPATWCAKRVDGALVHHGRFTARHLGDQRHTEGHYRNGKRHGRWAGWHPNGQRSYTGQFRNDRMVGRWRTWNADGTLKEESEFAIQVLE